MRHTQHFGRFQHRPRKQGEAFRVIRIISSGSPIESIAVEKWGIIHEVKLHSRLVAPAHNRTEAVAVIKRNCNTSYYGLRIGQLALAIPRHVHADLVSQVNESAGQGPDHVCQSTCLGKRHAFRDRWTGRRGRGLAPRSRSLGTPGQRVRAAVSPKQADRSADRSTKYYSSV